MIQELAKEFQEGYNFGLDKMGLPVDHELRVEVQKPELEGEMVVEEGEAAEEEVEAGKPHDDEAADDSVSQGTTS